MKSKQLLYVGIILLLAGLVLRYLTGYVDLGIGLVIVGVILKLSYIALSIFRGAYKPGAEFFLLLSGLVFLFLGLWHKLNVSEGVGYAMIVAAISFKLIFVILFIRETRPAKSTIPE